MSLGNLERSVATNSRRLRTSSIRAALDLLVLSSLKDRPLTGYEIIGKVHISFRILLSPGTIYPVLKHLEEAGFVNSQEEGTRRVYSQTSGGKAILESGIQSFTEIQVAILAFLHTTAPFVN
jgi:PadR family transcriptional regulator, regulatory protein PadR